MATAIAIALYLVGMIVVAIFVCIGLDWIQNKIFGYISRHDEMFVSAPPDFAAFEAFYGLAVPVLLRELYTSGAIHKLYGLSIETVSEEDESIRIQSCFTMSQATFTESAGRIGQHCYAFAADDFGNYYFIDLMNKTDDPQILYHDHDSNEISPTQVSLRQLLDATK